MVYDRLSPIVPASPLLLMEKEPAKRATKALVRLSRRTNHLSVAAKKNEGWFSSRSRVEWLARYSLSAP
jgi:hypothetical protein